MRAMLRLRVLAHNICVRIPPTPGPYLYSRRHAAAVLLPARSRHVSTDAAIPTEILMTVASLPPAIFMGWAIITVVMNTVMLRRSTKNLATVQKEITATSTGPSLTELRLETEALAAKAEVVAAKAEAVAERRRVQDMRVVICDMKLAATRAFLSHAQLLARRDEQQAAMSKKDGVDLCDACEASVKQIAGSLSGTAVFRKYEREHPGERLNLAQLPDLGRLLFDRAACPGFHVLLTQLSAHARAGVAVDDVVLQGRRLFLCGDGDLGSAAPAQAGGQLRSGDTDSAAPAELEASGQLLRSGGDGAAPDRDAAASSSFRSRLETALRSPTAGLPTAICITALLQLTGRMSSMYTPLPVDGSAHFHFLGMIMMPLLQFGAPIDEVCTKLRRDEETGVLVTWD